MRTHWWAPALSLAERCEIQHPSWDDASWDEGATARWREQWRTSVGFGGSAEDTNRRFARIAPSHVIDRALGLRLDELELDAPDWARRLNVLYLDQPWPATARIVEVLTDVPGVPEEAVYGALGGLVVAAPLLIDAQRRLDEGIAARMETHGQDAGAATKWRRMLWPTVVQRVAGVFARTLVLEVNADRVSGMLQGNTPEARHRSFVESLLAGPRALAIVEEYPVMLRHGLNVTEQVVDVLLELVDRLLHDRPLFHSEWGLDPDAAVAGFSLDAGDTHRNGRSVALIRFSDAKETVIVYKPRPMAVDAAFERMIGWYSDTLTAAGDLDLKVPGSIDRGDYGWSEFVRPAPCLDNDQVRRFYRRQGLILGLLHVLGGSDFHFENCIASGEYPMLIDLETLFHQLQQTQKPETMPDGDFEVFLELNRSVMQIGLLPIPLWGTEDRPGVDLSGLGGEPGQVIPQPHGVLKDGGTDQARIVRVDSHDLPGQLNRPTLNSEAVRTEDYIEDVVAGFRAGHQLFSNHGEELQSSLKGFQGVELRYIVRHTATYARLLTESSHPDLNRNALDRDCFLDGLWAAARHDESLIPIVEAERADLETGNIPLFTFHPESQSLHSFTGSTIPEFFPVSGIRALSGRARNLTDDDRDFQSWVIRASIASRGRALNQASSTPSTRSHTRGSDRARSADARACDAVERYATELVRTARGFDDLSWPTLAPASGGQWTIGPVDDSLYRGKSGLALFLHSAGRTLQREDLTDASQRLARGTLERLEHALSSPDEPPQELHRRLGAFDGIGGILHTALVTGASTPASLRDITMRALTDERTDQGPPSDVIAGLAGLVVVAQSSGLLTADQLAPLKERLGQHIAAAHDEDPAHTIGRGYGHGIDGILAALGDTTVGATVEAPRASSSTGGDGAPSAPDSVFRATSWCNGELGALARYVQLFPTTPAPAREALSSAASAILSRLPAQSSAYRDDTLCHGTAGALDLLVEAQSVGLVGDQWMHLKDRLVLDLLTRAETGALRSLVPHAVQTPGLLDGLSGMHLALLRAVDSCAGPSVLHHGQGHDLRTKEPAEGAWV